REYDMNAAMFEKEPLRLVGRGSANSQPIYDFIGDIEDEYLENYEEVSIDRGGEELIETLVLSNICQVLSKRDSFPKVLDVGCGRGYVLDHFKALEKVGLDVSLDKLLHISLESGIVPIRAFGEGMPFVSGYFDAVLCLDVFEHVRAAQNLVNEVSRVLKVGGSLFLACPWKQDLSVYDSERYKQEYKQYKYKHMRSIDQNVTDKLFYKFRMVNDTMVTAHERFMKLTPYSVRFMQFVLKEV
ncbi:unnamed protein product, partial [marine sediment metagenome]